MVAEIAGVTEVVPGNANGAAQAAAVVEKELADVFDYEMGLVVALQMAAAVHIAEAWIVELAA